MLLQNSLGGGPYLLQTDILEARGFAEARDRQIALAVSTDHTGAFKFQLPAAKCAMDALVGVRFQMHIVGCVRALASALDCYGSTIVGVLALPTPILTAGFAKAFQVGADPKKVTSVQQEFIARLKAAVDSAGPKGWDDWVLGLRNMLVHRGRRMNMNKVVPTGSRIITRSGISFGSRLVTVLPSDPDRSDVEVMRDASEAGLVLTEDAFETMEGAIRSTIFALETGAVTLREAWVERRTGRITITQPAAQWKDDSPANPFVGYAPGTEPFDPGQFHVNPVFGTRLRAASLNDAERARWATFD